jgi:hypothetical protein
MEMRLYKGSNPLFFTYYDFTDLVLQVSAICQLGKISVASRAGDSYLPVQDCGDIYNQFLCHDAVPSLVTFIFYI